MLDHLYIYSLVPLLYFGSPFVFGALQVISTHPYGTVFSFTGQQDNIHYLYASHHIAELSIDKDNILHHVATATSIWLDDPHITKGAIQSQLEAYSRMDDVWNDKFLGALAIFITGVANPTSVDQETYDWLASLDISHLFLSKNIPRSSPHLEAIPTSYILDTIVPGPFIISNRNDDETATVHEVYRLYSDDFDAFIFGAIPDQINGGWISTNKPLPHKDSDILDPPTQLIPVPSRLYALSTPNLPLSHTRFGLKDIYSAANLPTSAGSHAYRLTNPIPNSTAPSIRLLLALGAHMVGKTPSASSSGSACAAAAYDWLDFTVGSDTRGSVRKPAALVGVFGIRPSWGSLDLEGVVPLSEEMDTVGFFARNVTVFSEIHRLWYNSSVSRKIHFPARLLYPIDHFPMKSPAAQKLVDAFVVALQRQLNVTPSYVNFTEILTPFLPNGSFPAFQLSSNKLAEYRSWVDVGKPTTEKHLAMYGMMPTFDPVPEKMFSRAQRITEDDFLESVAHKRAFRDSLSEYVFRQDPASCSDSIFIYDAATGGLPSYRVEEFNHLAGTTEFLLTAAGAGNEAKAADFFNFVASMGELPEVTVPLGQTYYFSHISRTWEPMPVSIQLVTRKGCDRILVELINRLADVGVVRSVQAGRSML